MRSLDQKNSPHCKVRHTFPAPGFLYTSSLDFFPQNSYRHQNTVQPFALYCLSPEQGRIHQGQVFICFIRCHKPSTWNNGRHEAVQIWIDTTYHLHTPDPWQMRFTLILPSRCKRRSSDTQVLTSRKVDFLHTDVYLSCELDLPNTPLLN